jgi:hypothetical protein
LKIQVIRKTVPWKTRKREEDEENHNLLVQNPFQNYHGWTPVAHLCNPTYSEGSDQEDHDFDAIPGK